MFSLHEWINSWILLILTSLYAVIAYFSDFSRIFNLIVEDTVFGLYCKNNSIGDIHTWILLRLLVFEAFKELGEEFVGFGVLFKQLNVALSNTKPLTDLQRLSCEKLISDLEVNLLREFRLAGVSESHILISAEMLTCAISNVLEINGS